MKLLIAIGFYVLQPALWFGVLRAYLIHTKRIKRERKLFNSAIYEEFYEGRHFVRTGLIFGIGFSIIFGLLLTVSAPWVVIYESLLTISLVLIQGQLFGVTLVVLTSLIVLLVPGLAEVKIIGSVVSRLGLSGAAVQPANLLLITSLIMFATGLFVYLNGGRFNSPAPSRNRRHNRVAIYPFKELTVFPLVVLVPGDWLHLSINWLPLFQIHGQSYALLVVPILAGMKMTVNKSNPSDFLRKFGRIVMGLSLIGAVFSIIGDFKAFLVVPLLVVLWVIYCGTILIMKRTDKRLNFEYSEVMDGIRIIGIQPGTPAAKMNLAVGDVILSVNGIPVVNEDQFYRALSTNATYSRFKVRDRNDQLKVTESAIFKNSPHEIGIKTFASSDS